MKINDLIPKKESGSNHTTGGEHVDVVALIELYRLAKDEIEKGGSSLVMSKSDFCSLTMALRAFGHIQTDRFFGGVLTSITSINPNYPFRTDKDNQLSERLGVTNYTNVITDEEMPPRIK